MIRNFSMTLPVITALSLMAYLPCATAADGTDAKSVMHRNFEALMNLQPYAANPESFADPKNKDEIQKYLDSMSGLQHVFPKKTMRQEPGLISISNLFSDYLKDTQSAFRDGSRGSFVRNQIRTMTAFCMSCHTRVGSEQSFADLQNRVSSMNLTKFQKAEFYAATRQFDKSIATFDEIITTTPSGELGFVELGRAMRQALSVTIRVKQDPKATLSLLEKLGSRKDVPEFFQRYVAEWKKDANTWMQEKKKPSEMSASELMAKATALVEQATKRQLFPVDPTGDVSYLRATNYIHEALQKDPTGKFRGDALYLLGSCYDALQDPTLWALDTLYFEACVREFPHSKVSKKCYKRYASKLYFGYSGSAGTFIPEDEVKKLSELRELSQ